MRLALSLLFLAACTESDLDRLDGFIDKTPSVCASSQSNYVPTDTVDCMNDALTSGERAQASTETKDNFGFAVRTYMFTVDHEVHVFENHPYGRHNNDEPYASEKPTCAGPFHGNPSGGSPNLVTLVVDGCP